MLEFFKLKGLPGFHASEEVTQLFRTLLLTICIVIIVFASVDILAGGDPRGEIVNGIILIVTLITALPALANVVIFLIFVFILFGILGLHQYSGSMYYRCRETQRPFANGSWPIDPNQDSVCSKSDEG